MSNKIYFANKADKKNMKWYLTRALISTYRTVAPRSANKRLRALLLKPQKISLDELPAQIEQRSFETDHGQIVTYVSGKGPEILFVHGWSGAGQQFFPLMTMATELGFKAISFDHFAHGRSGHHEAYLPLLVKATDEVRKHYQLEDNLAAVVSHSLGCVASSNSFAQSITPQFMIAPLFNFLEALYSLVINSGLPSEVLDELIETIEVEHNVSLTSLDINDRIAEFKGLIEIVHDRRDRFSPYKLSYKTAQIYPAIRLHTTKGLGHTAILSDPEVLDMLTKFLHTAQNNTH